MKDKIQLLSTAPLDEALIEKAAYKKIFLDTISFINIKKFTNQEVKQRIEAYSIQAVTVIFTSVNAVGVVVDLLPPETIMPPWKIYCIGGATFTLLKKYWPFDSILYTAKNASDLARQILTDKVQDAVFFCGNLRREELPALLEKAAVKLQEVIVYETTETPVMINKEYSGILFFSPSAVSSFFALNNISPATILFAIGGTTAGAIRVFSSNPVIISEFPAKDQLVEKAIDYFTGNG